MKIIGIVLIVTGVLLILLNGLSMTFEGFIAGLTPIIIGIICIARSKKKSKE